MAMRNGATKALPGALLLVVHDFHARSPDELSLAKGDRVELVERYVIQIYLHKNAMLSIGHVNRFLTIYAETTILGMAGSWART